MSQTFCFSVVAEPTPGALGRVLEVFALNNHVPQSCYARVSGPQDRQDLTIDVQLPGVDDLQASKLAKKIAGLVVAQSVLYSKKSSST